MELRRRVYLLTAAAFAATVAVPLESAHGRVLLSQQQALQLAFPAGTKVERRTAFLTEPQRQAAEKAAGSRLDSRVWTYYVGVSTAGVAGTAYFESHAIRAAGETFMVVVDPDGTVRFVEILAFSEPDEYQPPKPWLKQFSGRPLSDEMALRRGLRNITGASLTSEAVTRGVRRVLAVHQVLNPRPPK